MRKSLEHYRSEHKSIPRDNEEGWEWWGLKQKKRLGEGEPQEGQGMREKGGGESLKHALFKMSQYYLTRMLISIVLFKREGAILMAAGQGRLNKLYKNNTKNQLNTNLVL